MTNKAKAHFLLITGFLLCPCHLIITGPIILGILGGTTIGVFLTKNSTFIITLLAIYFLVAVMLGSKYLKKKE